MQKQFHLAKTIPPCKNTSIFQKYFHLAKILPPCKNISTLQKYFHLAKKFSPCKNFFTLQKILPPCKNTYITEIMHTNSRPTLNLKYVSRSRGCCHKKKYVIGSLHLKIRFQMWFPLTKLLSVKKITCFSFHRSIRRRQLKRSDYDGGVLNCSILLEKYSVDWNLYNEEQKRKVVYLK